MSSQSLKKITVVLLLGLIFIVNMAPVSFAVSCPSKPDFSAPIGQSCGPDCQPSGDSLTCIPKGTVSDNATNPPSISGDTTWKTNCVSVTKMAKESDPCSDLKKLDNGEWYCCIVNKEIKPADLFGLKAVVPKYVPRVEIPCNTKIAGGSCPTNWRTDLGSYVGRVYQFGLMIAGLVAFGMFIYGAAQYTLSAGGFESKENAKDTMLNAIYGLLLLFGAYLILYTINPNLVKLGNIAIEPIDLSRFNPPEQVYIPADNNTVSESGPSNVSGIPHCLVSVSNNGLFGTGLNAGITIESSEGTQSYGIATTTKMLCTKCEEKYKVKDGACVAE